MSVTLINVFKVPAEQEQEFLQRWTETTKVYARTVGFLQTHLHRNIGVGSPTSQFINIALWASSEAFIQAHKDYAPGEESIPGIEFNPALFEEVIMTRNLLSIKSEHDE